MRNTQIVLFYLLRVLIFFVFCLILNATIQFDWFVQLVILTSIILYFLLFNDRLEYSLFEIHYRKKTKKKYLLVIYTILSLIFNMFLIYVLYYEFYLPFIILILVECSLKLFIDTNLEDIITCRKITFKGDINEIEV